MSVSGVKVEIAFDDDALAEAPSWTRIDEGVDGVAVTRIEISRGRSYELDKTQAATVTVAFTDTAGSFDPTNTLSPYAGNLEPNKQVRIQLRDPVADAYSVIFVGFTADWDYELYPTENIAYGTLSIVGPFDFLATLEMTPGQVGDPPPIGYDADIFFVDDAALDACQTRINKVLDDVGWPSSRREIFTGNVGLQAKIYPRLDGALAVLYDTADSEFPGVANVIERRDGAIVFHGRFARFNPENPDYDINFWSAGDDAACAADETCARMSEPFKFNKGNGRLINACIALPDIVAETDVPGNLIMDATSIGTYGWRSESFENLGTANGDGPTTAVEETKKYGQYYVDNYAVAQVRLSEITLKGQRPDGPYGAPQWLTLCGVDISDVFNVTTTHVGGGGINDQYFVEGIRYLIEPGSPDLPEVTLTLDLSPRAYFDTDPFSG